MKKIVLLLAFCISFFSLSFAQKGQKEYSGFFDSYYYKGSHNLNFTANFALPFYAGDLCEPCTQPGLGFGIGVNYKLWPRVMFGAEFNYLMLSGKDSDTRRNISFNTTGLEFTAYGRFFLVDDIIRVASDRNRKPKFLKPYITAGIGMLNYKATSTFTKPAPQTDSSFMYSENIAYPRTTVVIPLGFGLSWRLSNRFSLITEASYRITFSDYLDDVSRRGDPHKKDGYGLVAFKIQYSPFAPRKKKAKSTSAPEKYEGPKGTETWKNKKKEEPKQNQNYEEPLPTEEKPAEEGGEPTEEQPTEENQEQPQEEQPSDK